MILSAMAQARVIAGLLSFEEVVVDPGDLTEPWDGYYEWILDGDEETAEERWGTFLQEFLGRRKDREEHVWYCELIQAAREETGAGYAAVGEVLGELPELEWLWKGWLPRGLLSLLVAEPGMGKSYLALDLARRVIQGGEYPDGTPVGEGRAVLYVEAEHAPQIMKQRLTGWEEEELGRLFLMLPERDRLMIDLNCYDDRERLLDMVYQIRPGLVVIDSYGAVSMKGENAKEDVQALLSFLTRMAKDYGCGMMMIHHPRKRSSIQLSLPSMSMTIDAVRGSSYLVQIARLVLAMEWVQTGVELDRNGPRRLQVIKSNLDLYPEPLGVWFEPMEENPSVARLRYGDAPQAYRKLTKTEECALWLVEVLAEEGAVSLKTLVEWAEDEGWNKGMVCRARKRLGDKVVDSKGPYLEGNEWALAEADGET